MLSVRISLNNFTQRLVRALVLLHEHPHDRVERERVYPDVHNVDRNRQGQLIFSIILRLVFLLLDRE